MLLLSPPTFLSLRNVDADVFHLGLVPPARHERECAGLPTRLGPGGIGPQRFAPGGIQSFGAEHLMRDI